MAGSKREKISFFVTKEVPHVWLIMNKEFSTRK